MEVFDAQSCKGHLVIKMQREIKEKSPGNLIITLHQLSKFEAPSCNGL